VFIELLERPMVWRFLLPLALVAGAVTGPTAEAHADPTGSEVWYDADARTYGRDICAMIDKNPVVGVFDSITKALLSQTNVSLGDTGGVIGLSVKRYCPGYLPLANKYYNVGRVPVPANSPCENILAEPGMAGNVNCPGR
jgi:hypothetical protein